MSGRSREIDFEAILETSCNQIMAVVAGAFSAHAITIKRKEELEASCAMIRQTAHILRGKTGFKRRLPK